MKIDPACAPNHKGIADFKGLTGPQSQIMALILAAKIAGREVPELASEFEFAAGFAAGAIDAMGPIDSAGYQLAKKAAQELFDVYRNAETA
ncbi:hypothetical protein GGE07_001526 [Sinorhizobium terangae]|uniref:Uncharacterized protein n=1 Tax=Sinorhizobium terangae TaxID=110322 RepID=A0A6N7LKY5_SINTE|nr:hypothetical protein [Sinorhizobium terangae]MBB4184897.1 hypothetical protein [Sinorhizobium terangae]MQX18417.1 hypothetical protein [Sinorhizobium terangae]